MEVYTEDGILSGDGETGRREGGKARDVLGKHGRE